MTERPRDPEATTGRTEQATPDSKRVAATIRRIARSDRRILLELAAFDRGERSTT